MAILRYFLHEIVEALLFVVVVLAVSLLVIVEDHIGAHWFWGLAVCVAGADWEG